MKLSHALPVLAATLWVLVARAEDLEPLDAEFLEYLAALEGDDGDWTELADEKPPVRKCEASATATARSNCESDDTEDAARDAAKRP